MKKMLFLTLAVSITSILSAKTVDINDLQNSCNSSTPNAEKCAVLGDMYSLGHKVEKDSVRAFELYEKACELNSVKGCYSLGLVYQNDIIYKDEFLAKEAFKKACELGNNLACKKNVEGK